MVTPLGGGGLHANPRLDPNSSSTTSPFVKLSGKAGPTGSLPRLAPEAYRGRAVVLWTHTIARRSTGWLNAGFHAAFRESMTHAAVREQLFCPIYTLMPDHLHLIWMGLADGSDQRLATRFLRGDLASHLKPHGWQHQPHDRVMRDKERMRKAFAQIAQYLADNPVRARLTDDARSWPYTGSIVPGYPDLHPLRADFWGKFWRFYAAAVARGAVGKLVLAGEEPAV